MRNDYSADFEDLWKAYPPRVGDNPKLLAWKAYRARLREGVEPAELAAAVAGYAAAMRLRGKAGSEFVMQAATFLGPNERWKSYLPKPKPAGNGSAPKPAPEPDERATPEQHAAFRELLASLAAAKSCRGAR